MVHCQNHCSDINHSDLVSPLILNIPSSIYSPLFFLARYLFPEARETKDLLILQLDGTAMLFPWEAAPWEVSEIPTVQHITLNPFTTR